MKDLETLLSSDATDFERELLGAVSKERPSPELQLRMERALGLGPAALPGPDAGPANPELSGTHLAVKTGASQWAGGGLLKALLGVGVGAGLLAGGLALRSSQPTPQPAAPAVAEAPAPAAAAPVTLPPPARPEVAAPNPPSAEISRELREEIDLLDRVRAALGERDARTATALLDSYAARFPQGLLAREAGALRARATEAAANPSR